MEHPRPQFLPAARLLRLERCEDVAAGRNRHHVLHQCRGARTSDGLHYSEVQRLRLRTDDAPNAFCHDPEASMDAQKELAQQCHVLDMHDHGPEFSKSRLSRIVS